MLTRRVLRSCSKARNTSRRLACTHVAHHTQQTEQGGNAGGVKLTIQPAINRSPTELLSALASTVGVDSTAPHFQLIDDPAMIPSTAANKKTYLMAKELGKRAARQLATEWPTLFAFDRDQPRLEVFRPQKDADPLQVELTEASLLSFIEKKAVKDACILYERMRAEDKDVSEGAKEALFHLAAFYNSEDVPFAEEGEWPILKNLGMNDEKGWTSAGVADLVYETLPASVERTSFLITALAKFPSKEAEARASKLFADLLQSNASAIPARTFAAVMRKKNFDACQNLLKKMGEAKVRPTEAVWYEVISAAGRVEKYDARVSALRSTLGEMKALGEAPSLRCLDAVLRSLYRWDSEKQAKEEEKIKVMAVSVLSEFLTELEAKSNIDLVSAADSQFFVTAMNIVRGAGNVRLGRRLVSLYESKQNGVKMSPLGNEGIFYSSFLLLNATHLDNVDKLYELYISLVPRLVGVTRGSVSTFLERINGTPSWRLLNRVCEDAAAGRLLTESFTCNKIREALINTRYETLSPSERDEFSTLVHRLVSIWLEFSRFTDERLKRMQYKLAPHAISDCALLLLRVGDREQAWYLLDLLANEDNQQGEKATILPQGSVREQAMNELLDDAIRRGNGEEAATCLELLSRGGTSKGKLEQIANKIVTRCNVTPAQARLVQGFVRLRPQ